MNLKLEMVKLKDLIPNPENPRLASEDTLARLKASIQRFGFVEPVIAWRNEKGKVEIVAGHQRVKEAVEDGQEEVPTIIYPFPSRKEATAYNIASNRLAELSEWDFPKLKDNLEFLDDGEFAIDLTGFNEAEREALMTWSPPEGAKPPDLPDAALQGQLMNTLHYVLIEFTDIEEYQAFCEASGLRKGQRTLRWENVRHLWNLQAEPEEAAASDAESQ